MSDLPSAVPSSGPPTAVSPAATRPSGEGSPLTPPRTSGFWLQRRNIPVPTWRTLICLLATVMAGGYLLVTQLHPWLSPRQPVADAPYLAVEGWVPDHVMQSAITFADDHSVDRVFTTGLPVERGGFLVEYGSSAEITARSLAKMGLAPGLICPVPAADTKTERTRAMATALRDLLQQEPVPARGRKINIITQGTHGRRSLLIFRDVFGPDWEVGIVSVPSVSYPAERWYRYSEGAKNVLAETCALLVLLLGGN